MNKKEIAKNISKMFSTQYDIVPNISAFWSSLERMSQEGAIVVLKLDGKRETSKYTVVVSGGKLKENIFHKDHNDIELLISEAIIFYDANVWKTQ